MPRSSAPPIAVCAAVCGFFEKSRVILDFKGESKCGALMESHTRDIEVVLLTGCDSLSEVYKKVLTVRKNHCEDFLYD